MIQIGKNPKLSFPIIKNLNTPFWYPIVNGPWNDILMKWYVDMYSISWYVIYKSIDQ